MAYRTAAFWFFLPALYVFIFVVYSFQFKRSIFFPRYLFYDHPKQNAGAANAPPWNIYAIEDELCRLLDRGKSREIQWDVHLSWMAEILLIATILLLWKRPYDEAWREALALALTAGAVGPVAVGADWPVLLFRRKVR